MSLERRLSNRLVNFWQHIKGTHVLPEVRDMRRELIEDMWEDCFLVTMRDGATPETVDFYRYSHLGERLDDMFVPGDEPGQGNLITLPDDVFVAFCQEMFMTKLPVIDESDRFLLADGFPIKYRQCLLPLGTKDGHIRAIFGGMRWKPA